MKIVIVGSMTVVDKMIEVKKFLEKRGHLVFLSNFANSYSKLPKDQIESQTIHDKNNNNGLRDLCLLIKQSDSVLALNYEKNGIKNYVGGNSFLDLGYAFILGKKIFLMNPVPDMIYTSELNAMKPIVINEDLSKII